MLSVGDSGPRGGTIPAHHNRASLPASVFRSTPRSCAARLWFRPTTHHILLRFAHPSHADRRAARRGAGEESLATHSSKAASASPALASGGPALAPTSIVTLSILPLNRLRCAG